MDLPSTLRQAGIFEPSDIAVMRSVLTRLKEHVDRDLDSIAITVLRAFKEEPGDADHLWSRCRPLID